MGRLFVIRSHNDSAVFPLVSKILLSVAYGGKTGDQLELLTEIAVGGEGKEACDLSAGQLCKLQHIAGESNLFL